MYSGRYILKTMKRFKDFKEGETLWVFYNENYKEDLDKFHAKYSISPIIIESNESVIREIGKNSIKAKKIYNYIKFHFLGFIYERDYNNYYDDKNQMIITSEILENGPILKLFNSEESAKRYMNEFCKNLLNRLNKEIQQREDQKKLLKESIKNYE